MSKWIRDSKGKKAKGPKRIKSDLPDSNQRPKDYLFDKLQSSALPTELRSDTRIMS
ncbi:ATP-dependent protease ATPase subunit HslU2 [Bienertia sinuspersici]